MTDVAPALLEAITKDVTRGIDGSQKIQNVLALIRSGKATYADSFLYAREMGEILSGAFKTHLSSAVLPDGRMYYNIAQRILDPTLKTNHDLIADIAEQVQQIMNEESGIGLKAIRPALDQTRIDGFIERISREPIFDEIAWILQEPVIAFSEHVIDEAVRENVNFHGAVGLQTTVTRTTDADACKWCRDVAGKYEYPGVPDDVWRRHDRCHCLVVFKSDKVTNIVHSGTEGKRKYVRTDSGSYKLTKEEKDRRAKLGKTALQAEAKAKAERNERIKRHLEYVETQKERAKAAKKERIESLTPRKRK